jgi:putative FmdB family regulatory protein
MPLYEYICLDCIMRFDALRPMKDADTPIQCVKCSSEHTSRQLSVFFAHSEGRLVAQSAPSCAGCAGGSCAGCGGH